MNSLEGEGHIPDQAVVIGGQGWPISVGGGREVQQFPGQVEDVGGRGRLINDQAGVVGWQGRPVPVEKVYDMVVFLLT